MVSSLSLLQVHLAIPLHFIQSQLSKICDCTRPTAVPISVQKGKSTTHVGKSFNQGKFKLSFCTLHKLQTYGYCKFCQSAVGICSLRSTLAKWPIRLELIPVSVALSDLGYFYSPLDGMLFHLRVTPQHLLHTCQVPI